MCGCDEVHHDMCYDGKFTEYNPFCECCRNTKEVVDYIEMHSIYSLHSDGE